MRKRGLGTEPAWMRLARSTVTATTWVELVFVLGVVGYVAWQGWLAVYDWLGAGGVQ